MSSCITSAAASAVNMQTLQDAAKTLSMAKDDPWWDYPNLYKVDDDYVWSDQGREDGLLFRPPSSFQNEFYLKKEVAPLPGKLSAIEGELNNPGGDFSFTPARIESIRQALKRAIGELNSVLATTAMNGGYGGRDTGMIPITYFATFTEIANIRYVRAQLATASNQVDQVLSTLFASDCNEPEGGENCDRIAAALEALAAKDFGGNVSQALDKIAAAVGAEPLAAGVTVPRLVTEEDGGGTVTIRSIPEFIRWQFLQIDALIGRFPLKIKATDTEADEEGDQSREYIAGNLSDAIASLIGLAITNDTAVDSILKGTMTACTEIASSRLIGIKSNAILESLEEWASYTVKEETIEVPFAFDVEGKTIDTALVAKRKKVKVSRWSGDGKNDFDIERIGKIVNTIYAVVMTAFGHRFDPKNPEAQFKQDLEALKNTNDQGDEDDFSAWADRVENEFSDAALSRHQAAGEVRPYGRPMNRRPRIKQIEGQGTEDIDGETP